MPDDLWDRRPRTFARLPGRSSRVLSDRLDVDPALAFAQRRGPDGLPCSFAPVRPRVPITEVSRKRPPATPGARGRQATSVAAATAPRYLSSKVSRKSVSPRERSHATEASYGLPSPFAPVRASPRPASQTRGIPSPSVGVGDALARRAAPRRATPVTLRSKYVSPRSCSPPPAGSMKSSSSTAAARRRRARDDESKERAQRSREDTPD